MNLAIGLVYFIPAWTLGDEVRENSVTPISTAVAKACHFWVAILWGVTLKLIEAIPTVWPFLAYSLWVPVLYLCLRRQRSDTEATKVRRTVTNHEESEQGIRRNTGLATNIYDTLVKHNYITGEYNYADKEEVIAVIDRAILEDLEGVSTEEQDPSKQEETTLHGNEEPSANSDDDRSSQTQGSPPPLQCDFSDDDSDILFLTPRSYDIYDYASESEFVQESKVRLGLYCSLTEGICRCDGDFCSPSVRPCRDV